MDKSEVQINDVPSTEKLYRVVKNVNSGKADHSTKREAMKKANINIGFKSEDILVYVKIIVNCFSLNISCSVTLKLCFLFQKM